MITTGSHRMNLRWPPRPLGLGTPLNLAAVSLETRPLLRREWWLAPVVGLAVALVVVGMDVAIFGGTTVRHIPPLGSHPPLAARVLVVFLGSVFEEFFFRVFLATLVAWVAFLAIRQFKPQPQVYAQSFGIIVAALTAGLWHVGSSADLVRVMAVNAIVGTLYGWFYWWRGLELAIVTHMVVTACLYIGVPALR